MNSSQRIAAQRYAAAFDKISTSPDEAVRHAQELSQAAQALAPADAFFNAPEIALTQKKQAVSQALAQLPQTSSFLQVLLDAKRYNLLPQIVKEVAALADKRQGILRAQVVSAAPLSDEEKQHTQNALEARYGNTVKAVFQTDKNILGGLKIMCNGELLDGSLQGQLDRLQEELTK